MARPSSPPLHAELQKRTFVAANGEYGFRIEDLEPALAVLAAAHQVVLGWELWLIDHMATPDGAVPAPGYWCGLIPTDTIPAVFTGSGSPDETRRQIATMDISDVADQWRPYLRINLTYQAAGHAT